MLNKSEIEFEGTLAEFNAWAAETFKDPGKVRVRVDVQLMAVPQSDDPLIRAIANTFRRDIGVEAADEIRLHVKQGNRINAIKTLRAVTGLGLAASKQFLEDQFPV